LIVLNVGGGSRYLPPEYKGWDQDLLDIDPEVKPDILCDAKNMRTIKKKYDAVLCSHNLEHFYRHEVPQVLDGIRHVLKEDGFADIRVPNLNALVEAVHKGGLDIDDPWYDIGNGTKISFHDVLYGWGKVMKQGNLFYSHKCGFTEKSLGKELTRAGFKTVLTASDGMNVNAYAFKGKPTASQKRQLGI
jgi:ubiquinone/menaquinone biosynthesis C-methylase UbiE